MERKSDGFHFAILNICKTLKMVGIHFQIPEILQQELLTVQVFPGQKLSRPKDLWYIPQRAVSEFFIIFELYLQQPNLESETQ